MTQPFRSNILMKVLSFRFFPTCGQRGQQSVERNYGCIREMNTSISRRTGAGFSKPLITASRSRRWLLTTSLRSQFFCSGSASIVDAPSWFLSSVMVLLAVLKARYREIIEGNLEELQLELVDLPHTLVALVAAAEVALVRIKSAKALERVLIKLELLVGSCLSRALELCST
ncbi:hypothetical protein K469DRAFT_696520 [Zopfia rhizophila CBS 207.26]|uniref:Uncharacterized protein n=1 Tax=Zopfia rhizophila CBS 207.26 TaxID=1314779 RepID=A0A6A6DDT9_9PEZI|nr:hypothetical protein K469DRAFT_696520 [Zopfia rhizophila CBS 207.26]